MELEVNCARCEGKGQILFVPAGNKKGTGYYVGCPAQCINGKIPSEFGIKVIDFVGKWLLSDVTDDVNTLKRNVRDLEK